MFGIKGIDLLHLNNNRLMQHLDWRRTEFMKSVCRYILVCLACFISGCNGTSKNGIIEANEDFESTPELIACSKNTDCSDHAEALFWVAAMDLSNLSTEEIDVDWYDLTHQDRVGLFEEILEPDYDPPDYDVSTLEFLKAYSQMKRAHDLGNSYASNELGLIHLKNPDLKDLDLALQYLKVAEKSGDGYGAFNLVRLYLTESKRDDARALSAMKNAATSSDNFRYYNLKLQVALNPAFQLSPEQSDYLESKDDSEEARDWENMFAPYIDDGSR